MALMHAPKHYRSVPFENPARSIATKTRLRRFYSWIAPWVGILIWFDTAPPPNLNHETPVLTSYLACIFLSTSYGGAMDPKYAALKTIEDISILKGTAFETI